MNRAVVNSRYALENLVELQSASTEEFWILLLSASKKLLKKEMLFRGSIDACPVHPREIFRAACLNGASGILVAHNHPTGEPLPSDEDIGVTRRLAAASKIMLIPLVDHLIIAPSGYFSFSDAGWLKPTGFLPVFRSAFRDTDHAQQSFFPKEK